VNISPLVVIAALMSPPAAIDIKLIVSRAETSVGIPTG
jgi:hypothetical protein